MRRSGAVSIPFEEALPSVGFKATPRAGRLREDLAKGLTHINLDTIDKTSAAGMQHVAIESVNRLR